MLDKEKLIAKIELADHILSDNDANFKLNMLKKYDMFFESLKNLQTNNVLKINKDKYSVILNRVTFFTITLGIEPTELKNYDNLYYFINKEIEKGSSLQAALTLVFRMADTNLNTLSSPIKEIVDTDDLRDIVEYWELKQIYSQKELDNTDYKNLVLLENIDSSKIKFDNFDNFEAAIENEIVQMNMDDPVGEKAKAEAEVKRLQEEARARARASLLTQQSKGNSGAVNISKQDKVDLAKRPLKADRNNANPLLVKTHMQSDLGNEIEESVRKQLEINAMIEKQKQEDAERTRRELENVQYKSFSLEERKKLLGYIWPTKILIAKKVPKELLAEYIEKRNIVQRLVANRYNYYDTEPNGGLSKATILLSNLHYAYIRGIKTQMEYLKKEYVKQIRSHRDLNNGAKIALGILKDYDDGVLSYDEIPIDVTVYIERFIDNSSFNNLNLGDMTEESMLKDERVLKSIRSAIDDDVQNFENLAHVSSSKDAQFFTRNKLNKVVLNPRQSQIVNKLVDNSFLVPMISPKHPMYKVKKELYMSLGGAEYAYTTRWEGILEALDSLINNNGQLINRISLVGSSMVINDQLVVLEDYLGGDEDIRLEDICSLKALMVKYKCVQQLVIDTNITNCLIREYGNGLTGVCAIFNENPYLQYLGLIDYGEDNPVVISRQLLNEAPDAVERQMKKYELRMDLDAFSAKNNPRLHEKSPGYIYRFFKNSNIQNSAMTNSAKIPELMDKDPVLMRYNSYSLSVEISKTVNNLGNMLNKHKN